MKVKFRNCKDVLLSFKVKCRVLAVFLLYILHCCVYILAVVVIFLCSVFLVTVASWRDYRLID